MELAPNHIIVEVAKAIGGSFKLVTPAPRTVREMTQLLRGVFLNSTTMKLRKSLVKPVMRQNILSCLVLPPEIVMHDVFSVILRTSADCHLKNRGYE